MTHPATHILLVEDNLPEARLIAELLRDSGQPFEVACCESLAVAEEHLRTRRPEAVLLDLSLPDSQGLATLERVLAAAPDIPVLVLTGLEDERIATEAIGKGAEDYLIKGQAYGRVMVRSIHYAIQRNRMRQEQIESQRRLNLLVRTSVAVIAARDLHGLLQKVVDAARLLTGSRLGVCGHAYTEATFRVMAASRADDAIACPPGETFKVERGGVYLDLFRSHETIRLTDAELRRHPKWWGLPESHAPLRGLLAARLINAEGATDSIIMLSDKIAGDFTEEDEVLLKQLAAITSLAMQHIKARTDAEEANRAKSRFLANMSHELRTPMNAVLGMTDLALGEKLSPSVRDCLQTAKDSAGSLLDLLNDLLDFSRIEAGRLELESAPFRLRPLLAKILKPLDLAAGEKGLDLACDVTADVPDRLLGDPLRLRQILVNLVGNAVKFTPSGSVALRVEVERQGDKETGRQGDKEGGRKGGGEHRPSPPLPVSVSPPLSSPSSVTLKFAVSDTGIGISPEDQQKIFAPFAQADPSTTRRFGGTGLGLAIVNSLVTLMGGKLWLESRLGNGSTFHFTIRVGLQRGPSKRPATFTGDERSGRADTRGERPGPGGAATARPLRILLAEDTRANQKLVVFILRKQGHSVEVADNGAKALELVRRHDFDLVLMDVQMPDMDGLQATREIRALADPRKARVPIVAMTAYAMKGDQSRCLDAGMDAYLSKPVDADELIETIQRMAAPGPNTGKGAGGGLSQFSFACPGGQAENGTVPLRLAPRPGAEEPVAVCEPIFDAAGALAHCAGQQSILADMASFYLDNVGTWIDELRGAAEAGAAAELSHLAHRLRGTLLYLAARPSERLAGEVEQLAASSGAAGASAALERLIASLGPLEEALRQFRPT